MKHLIVKLVDGSRTWDAPMVTDAWIQEQVDANTFGSPQDYTMEVIDLDVDYNFLLEQCQRERAQEYPSLTSCVEAIMEALTEGRSDKLNELAASRLAVKSKYPKPVK